MFNKNSFRGALAVAMLAALGSANAALGTEVTTGISGAVADILAVIALGGAAFITISGGGVVWNVASKFIKRLGGKA